MKTFGLSSLIHNGFSHRVRSTLPRISHVRVSVSTKLTSLKHLSFGLKISLKGFNFSQCLILLWTIRHTLCLSFQTVQCFSCLLQISSLLRQISFNRVVLCFSCFKLLVLNVSAAHLVKPSTTVL